MTNALPFTEASLARRIKGARKAGLFVVGVTSNGTIITADKPVDPSSLIPADKQDCETSKWEDKRG
jgi:hypothetical protein